MSTTEIVWLSIGVFGQSMFFMRWLVQWLASERHNESRMPIMFWYMSLGGGLITLAYAIYRKDPVFIAGQSVGAFVYLRNLMLLHRTAQTRRDPDAAPARSQEEPSTPGG